MDLWYLLDNRSTATITSSLSVEEQWQEAHCKQGYSSGRTSLHQPGEYQWEQCPERQPLMARRHIGSRRRTSSRSLVAGRFILHNRWFWCWSVVSQMSSTLLNTACSEGEVMFSNVWCRDQSGSIYELAFLPCTRVPFCTRHVFVSVLVCVWRARVCEFM